ncbi:MmgE/PrpD family protein [Chloroflexota bacterium]
MATEGLLKRDGSVELVENVVNTRYEDLSPKDRDVVKKDILDTLGCVIAGSSHLPFEQLVAYLKDQGGKAESTIMVYGGKVPALSAALANAGMARALDLDSVYWPTGTHISATIVPASFAVAERQGGINGKDLITAVVLGEDTGLRIMGACKACPGSLAKRTRAGSFIGGTFGAAMVAGKLMKLDNEKMLDAFGNAYCQVTGDMACLWGGALSQPVHQGIVARAGIFSAILASIGVTGTKDVLEGKWGYYQTFENGVYSREALTTDLGKRFWGTGVSVKPYCCCAFPFTPMWATKELVKEHDISPEEIEEITVFCSEDVLTQCSPDRIDPKTAVDLHYSLPWAVGVVAAKGEASIEDFTLEGKQKVRDVVVPLARKVKGVHEPEFDVVRLRAGLHGPDFNLDRLEERGNLLPAVVEIRTKQRGSYKKRVDYGRGNPQNPMSWEEIAAKFRDCARFVARPLSHKNIEQVIELVRGLEEVEDVALIATLLS